MATKLDLHEFQVTKKSMMVSGTESVPNSLLRSQLPASAAGEVSMTPHKQ